MYIPFPKITAKEIIALSRTRPFDAEPRVNYLIEPLRPESPRVLVSPIGGEAFEGVAVREHDNFYVVAPDYNHAHRENWNKGVCQLLPIFGEQQSK